MQDQPQVRALVPLPSSGPAMCFLHPGPVLQRPQPHGWSADREHVLSCTLTLQIATGGSAGRRQLSVLGRLPGMHVASGEGVNLLV